MVEEEGDAASAAVKEGHVEIVRYFETSDACKKHRHRKQFRNDMSARSSPVDDGDFSWISRSRRIDRRWMEGCVGT